MATGLATSVFKSRIGDRLDVAANTRTKEIEQPSSTSMIRESSIDTGKALLHYLQRGPADGPVIVLLHGSGDSNYWTWREVMKRLPNNYLVLAPGFQGFGNTELPEGTKCTIDHLAGSTRDFLAAKGIDRQISIMGTSAGAFVAIMFTANNPGMVERIAVIDSYDPTALANHPRFISWVLSHPPLSMKALGFGLRHKGAFKLSLKAYEQLTEIKINDAEQSDDKKESPETKHKNTLKVYFKALRDMRKAEHKIPDEVVEGIMEYLNRIRPAFFHIISDHRRHADMYNEMLATIRERVPVRVVIHGEGDWIINPKSSKKAAELMDAKYHPIAGSRHAPYMDNLERFMEIVRTDFLPREKPQEVQIQEEQSSHQRSLMSRLLRREDRRQHQKRVHGSAAETDVA